MNRQPADLLGHVSRRLAVLVVLAVGCGLLCGCAGPNMYRARTLPAGLAAIEVPNVKRLDLSGLAGPSTGSDMIRPGDMLELSIVGGLGADAISKFSARVGDDGNALLSDIGAVRLAGLELPQAEQVIRTTLIQRGLYVQPHVAISMEQRRINRVMVVGAVETPGFVELPRGQSYLLDAFVAAGGLTDDAAPDVNIRIPGSVNGLATAHPAAIGPDGVMTAGAQRLVSSAPKSYRVNIVDAVMSGQSGQYLPDNAVVVVEEQELAPIKVIGLVSKPGEYEYPTERPMNVLGALALAQGASNPFADKVYVIRQREEMSDPAVIELSLRDAKKSGPENLRLEPGDVVSVERTTSTVMWDTINVVRFSLGSSIPLF